MTASSAQLDPQRSAPLAWLHTLYILLETARRDGLLALEGVLDEPREANTPFSRFPLTHKEPYQSFVCDVFQVRLAGVAGEPLRRYGEAAVWGFLHHSGGRRSVDESRVRTLWQTLEAGLVDEVGIRTACEFGRQAMSWCGRPSYEALLSSLEVTPLRLNKETGSERDFDERLDDLMESLLSDEPSGRQD